MPERNEKYVVFKREDYEREMGQAQISPNKSYFDAIEVPDAVVIRRQDVFASPAFDSYSNTILAAAETIRYSAGTLDNDILQKQLAKLNEVADYFHEQAELSAHVNKKLPD